MHAVINIHYTFNLISPRLNSTVFGDFSNTEKNEVYKHMEASDNNFSYVYSDLVTKNIVCNFKSQLQLPKLTYYHAGLNLIILQE